MSERLSDPPMPVSGSESRLFFHWSELNTAERLARLRSLQAIALLCVGGKAPLVKLLRQAETSEVPLYAVWKELNTLPTRTFRNILATFAATLP